MLLDLVAQASQVLAAFPVCLGFQARLVFLVAGSVGFQALAFLDFQGHPEFQGFQAGLDFLALAVVALAAFLAVASVALAELAAFRALVAFPVLAAQAFPDSPARQEYQDFQVRQAFLVLVEFRGLVAFQEDRGFPVVVYLAFLAYLASQEFLVFQEDQASQEAEFLAFLAYQVTAVLA